MKAPAINPAPKESNIASHITMVSFPDIGQKYKVTDCELEPTRIASKITNKSRNMNQKSFEKK